MKFAYPQSSPPLTPEDFVEKLETNRTRLQERGLSLFTSGKDCDIVPRLYRDNFDKFVRETNSFVYDRCGWMDVDALQLSRVLSVCNVLYINLDNNLIGDAGISAICDAVSQPQVLRNFCAMANNIEDKGAASCAAMISDLQSLGYLRLEGNPFCDFEEAVGHVKKAWAKASKNETQLLISGGERLQNLQAQKACNLAKAARWVDLTATLDKQFDLAIHIVNRIPRGRYFNVFLQTVFLGNKDMVISLL